MTPLNNSGKQKLKKIVSKWARGSKALQKEVFLQDRFTASLYTKALEIAKF